MTSNTRVSSKDVALVLGVPLLVYWVLQVATINGDGLYYYGILFSTTEPDEIFLPGHLLYLPLVSVVGTMVHGLTPQVGWPSIMVAINCAAGALTLLLTFLTARALGLPRAAQFFCTAGLAISYGFWVQATDAETYALALLGVVATFYLLARFLDDKSVGWIPLLAATSAFAVLMHVATAPIASVAPFAILIMKGESWSKRIKLLAVYVAALATLLLAPILLVGFLVKGANSTGDIVYWLTHWKADTPPMLNLLVVPRAVYGFIRTFVYLEFFWDGPRWLITTKILFFAATLGFATLAILRSPPAWQSRAMPFWCSLAPFILAEVAIGIWHYGSDTERWVFLAPLVWLFLAGAITSQRRAQLAFVALAVLAAVNVVQAFIPASLDSSIKSRVFSLYTKVPREAAVLSPGLDWTSYIEFYSGWKPYYITFDAIMKGRRDNQSAFLAELDAQIDRARRDGRPVVMVNILDPTTNFRRTPWPGLVDWGYSIQEIQRWARGYKWREDRLDNEERTIFYWLVD